MTLGTTDQIEPRAVSRFQAAEAALFDSLGLPVSSRFVDVPLLQARVRVLECGDGPPVLLLPGVGAVAAVWAPLLARLAGFRLISIERPGCGLSDRFALGGHDLREWLDLLAEGVVESLGLERLSLVGNSIGGTTALWYALANSNRVDRLVLIGAPPFVLDKQAPLSMRILSLPAITRKALSRNDPAAVDAVFTRMGHRPHTLSVEMAELVTASRELPGYIDGFIGVLHNATGLLRRHVSASARELASLQRPVLLVWGDRDTHGPVSTGRRLMQTMPDAQLEVVQGGHLPWLDDPRRCADLIRGFLAGREGSA